MLEHSRHLCHGVIVKDTEETGLERAAEPECHKLSFRDMEYFPGEIYNNISNHSVSILSPQISTFENISWRYCMHTHPLGMHV